MNCKHFQEQIIKQNDPAREDDPDLSVTEHLGTCQVCREVNRLDRGLEIKIQSAFQEKEVPGSLFEKINSGLDQVPVPQKNIWKRVAVAAVVILLAGITAGGFLFRAHPFQYKNLQQLGQSAVTAHLKGNTKILFSAKELDRGLRLFRQELKFNVMVPDLPSDGFVLIGGRLCAFGKCRIAYLFYEKNNKIGSLAIMDESHLGFQMADGSRFSDRIKGFHTDIWKQDGQVYAMVY